MFAPGLLVARIGLRIGTRSMGFGNDAKNAVKVDEAGEADESGVRHPAEKHDPLREFYESDGGRDNGGDGPGRISEKSLPDFLKEKTREKKESSRENPQEGERPEKDIFNSEENPSLEEHENIVSGYDPEKNPSSGKHENTAPGDGSESQSSNNEAEKKSKGFNAKKSVENFVKDMNFAGNTGGDSNSGGGIPRSPGMGKDKGKPGEEGHNETSRETHYTRAGRKLLSKDFKEKPGRERESDKAHSSSWRRHALETGAWVLVANEPQAPTGS